MRLPRALALLAWLLVGALAARTGAGLWRVAAASDALPKWDMAKYGAAGAHLTHAVKALDPLDLARSIWGLDLWGPVFPMIEATAFLPFGSTYRTAQAEMVVLFVLTVVAGFWAGRQVAGVGGDLAGALVAASVAASPAFQLYGTLVMLEVAGALLLFLAVGSYAHSLRSGAPRDFTLACLAAVLLFFLKFNYGLAWLVPFVLAEIWLTAGSLTDLRAQAVTHLRSVELRRPWPIFLLAYAAGLVALALFGGRVSDPGGQAGRSISLGTPLYVLYILVLARALIRPRRSWARLEAWYAAAGSRPRAIALVVLLPIAVWMLAPSHARGFVRVLENRDAGPSLWTLRRASPWSRSRSCSGLASRHPTASSSWRSPSARSARWSTPTSSRASSSRWSRCSGWRRRPRSLGWSAGWSRPASGPWRPRAPARSSSSSRCWFRSTAGASPPA
jgi:hypothetical protein